MIMCNNNCEDCRKYTSVHYNGTEYTEYDCLVANKSIKIIYDENGTEERREIF